MKYEVEIEGLPSDFIPKRINFRDGYKGVFCRNMVLDNVCVEIQERKTYYTKALISLNTLYWGVEGVHVSAPVKGLTKDLATSYYLYELEKILKSENLDGRLEYLFKNSTSRKWPLDNVVESRTLTIGDVIIVVDFYSYFKQ